MRFIAVLTLALALAPFNLVAQDAVSRTPLIVEQTYWIKPGKELQFIGLFEKYRVPLLRNKMKEGRILWVRLARPQFNAANEQWDLRATVAWRDADSAMGTIAQAKTQMTMEQQIMDELIVERTDVPVQEWSVNGAGS